MFDINVRFYVLFSMLCTYRGLSIVRNNGITYNAYNTIIRLLTMLRPENIEILNTRILNVSISVENFNTPDDISRFIAEFSYF